MNLKLVDATAADLVIINELMRKSKAYWGYDDDFMHKFISLFQMTEDCIGKSTTKLLFDTQSRTRGEHALIGFYSLTIDRNNELELDNFFISPDYIGTGLGKKLWGHLLGTVKILNKNEFVLWSDPCAEGFYEKMGCIKIGTKKSPMLPNRYPIIFKYLL